MSEVKPCRVAFAGAGAMINEHARAIAAVPGVELVGIYNRTVSKAKRIAEEQAIPVVSDDLELMLNECKPDLVVMAVYETAILDVAERILAHPVSLFMEKPIGLDLGEARKIYLRATNLERKVWVGLNRRTLGSTETALADLTENPGPRFIHIQDQQSLDVARTIGHAPVVIQNWMYANSIHLIDYLSVFARGEVAELNVLQPWNGMDPGVVVAHVLFTSGDAGLYQANWNGPGPWSCSVSAPHRRWEMRPLEKAIFQNAGERTLNEIPVSDFDTRFKPGFRTQAEKVVGAWRGEETGAATIDDALATTELVAKIYGLEASQ